MAVLLRPILVILFVLVTAAQVVRTAAVAAFAEDQPGSVAPVWPSHPDVIRSVAMAGVGEAAGAGQSLQSETLERLEQLAKVEPLAAEPFLVHSAIAQTAGDFPRAEQLLLHARDLAPRSAAARFLLADLYLRTDRIVPGLAEIAVLGRLVPGGMQQVVPSLAAYATTAGAATHLRRILAVYPELGPALLNQLAEDPAHTDLILSIAGPSARATTSTGGPQPWQEKLLRKLVEQGSFARAHSVWARLSGVEQHGSQGLFNADFERSSAPPPFNWTLESSGRGVAEPADGSLRILYFGRDNIDLATQLMLLPPGRYRLQMNVSGELRVESEIGWTVTCLPRDEQILHLPLRGGAAEGQVGDEFLVPAEGCAAQSISLKAVGEEFPQAADFRIADLQLTRVAS